MNNGLSRSLLINAIWSLIGRFGYLSVVLITNMILVRLLSPKEFGQVGIMMFFVVISTVLVESGLSGALVRKQNVTENDYSTIFIFNLIVSLILMGVLVVTSEFIANFYHDAELKNILCASSFILVINALRIVQNTKLVKNLQFKLKAIYELIAVLIGSLIAVYLALKGAGVWALVFLQLSTSFFLTCLLWVFVEPIKSFKFSTESFKQFYKFGFNTTLASLLNTAFDNIYQLILAKYFSISHAGYFYQAKKLQEMPTEVLNSIMQGPVYSALARIQNNSKEFNSLYQQVSRFFTVLTALICLLIYCYASAVIYFLYGSQWADSIFYLQVLAIAAFFYLQEMFNRIIFKIFNQTEKILQLEFLKKIIQLITIVYGIGTMSIENLMYGLVLSSLVGFMVNYYYAKKVQKYFDWSEVIMLVKITIVAIFIGVVFDKIFISRNEIALGQLLTIPLVVLIYFTFLQIIKIINIRSDLPKIIALLK